jgi:hypothetical protein
MVAITTAITGRPMSGRRTTRSRQAERDHAGEPRDATHRRARRAHGQRHRQPRDHHELALREVHRVGGLVDEHEAEAIRST